MTGPRQPDDGTTRGPIREPPPVAWEPPGEHAPPHGREQPYEREQPAGREQPYEREQPAEPEPLAEPVAGTGTLPPQHQIDRTRAGGLWVAVAAAALVLLLLLIFILQNNKTVKVSFLMLDGSLPLGVAMLLSAVAGALLVALVGTARIVQLRRVARRHRRADSTLR